MDSTNLKNICEAVVIVDYESGEILEKFGKEPFKTFNNINSIEDLDNILSSYCENGAIPIFKHIKADGKKYWIMRKKNSNLLYYFIINLPYIDYLLKKLTEKSRIDSLTNCYNKAEILSQIERFLLLFLRHKDPFSLIMYDIDYFKKINDTYGHLAGDYVLIKLSNIVKSLLRKSDICGRFGGEEFIIILPKTKVAGALKLANRIREACQKYSFEYNGKKIDVTISLGVTTANINDSVASLIERCDKALYDAKKNGRNRVEYR